MSIDNRIDNILKFKEEHPGIDPNLFELAEVARQTATMLNEQAPNYGIHQDPERYAEQKQTADKYFKLQQINAQALLDNDLGIDKGSAIYKMIENMSRQVNTYGSVPEYYSKLMGVKLYIKQQVRAVKRGEQDKVVFDNEQELEYLRGELSRVYKQMLRFGRLSDSYHPEIEVYKEVFEVYSKSVQNSGHMFDMTPEDYVMENDLKKETVDRSSANDMPEWKRQNIIKQLREQVYGDDEIPNIMESPITTEPQKLKDRLKNKIRKIGKGGDDR